MQSCFHGAGCARTILDSLIRPGDLDGGGVRQCEGENVEKAPIVDFAVPLGYKHAVHDLPDEAAYHKMN